MKKSRVAIYYHSNFGRNDGPPLYYFNVLNHMKDIEAVHLMPEGDTRRFGKFDYHFWVDYGEDGLPVDHEWRIPQDGGKTIYVASDTHLDDGYRYRKAQLFDYVFFNQKRAVDEYNIKYVGKVCPGDMPLASWLPHAAEPQAYPKFNIAKKYDIVFIGHVQETKNYNGFTRVEMLDRAFKEFPNFYFGTRSPQDPTKNMFEDASKKFCQSRIVLNTSIKDDLNMRLFEVLSSGSFLLTNYLPTLPELFEEGKHLVTYNSLDEMVQKIQYYLEHEEEREKIAKAGHKEFMEKHTYRHRVDTIFQVIKGGK